MGRGGEGAKQRTIKKNPLFASMGFANHFLRCWRATSTPHGSIGVTEIPDIKKMPRSKRARREEDITVKKRRKEKKKKSEK